MERMNRKLRVAHYCPTFSLVSETFIYEYVREIERQGDDCYVLAHQRRNPTDRPFPKVRIVDRAGRWHPRCLWRRALVPLGIGEAHTTGWSVTRDRLESSLRRIQPDVIHAHFGPEGVKIAPVAQALDIPLVTTFYGYDISRLAEEEFWKSKYERLWSRVQAVTVLSEEMKGAAKRLRCPEEKLNVIHLSCDLDQFSFRAPTRKVEKLLFVGRLVPKKAPLDALRAVHRILSEGGEVSLDVVGDGELREEVEAYVADQDLSHHIAVHGRVPNAEVGEYMQAADAFILPSKTAPSGDREGTPTVLVEAQAVGLPCISTRHAGIPEMIPQENHDLLAPEGDVEVLAGCIRQLMSRSVEELRDIAKRGREKMEDDFNLPSEVGSLRMIYREITSTAYSQE